MHSTRLSGVFVLVGGLVVWAAHPGAQGEAQARKLQLSFDKGNVTLIAQAVSVREIFAEWARTCGCVVKDADKIPGGPVSLQFENQPERAVLESLLKDVAGYVITPRLPGETGASQAASVRVFPTSHASAVTSYSSGSSPVAAPLMAPVTPDDEIPPVTPIASGPAQVKPPATTAPSVMPPAGVFPGTGRAAAPPTATPPSGGRGGGPGH